MTDRSLSGYGVKMAVAFGLLGVLGSGSVIFTWYNRHRTVLTPGLITFVVAMLVVYIYLSFLSYLKKAGTGKKLYVLPIIGAALLLIAFLLVLYIILEA